MYTKTPTYILYPVDCGAVKANKHLLYLVYLFISWLDYTILNFPFKTVNSLMKNVVSLACSPGALPGSWMCRFCRRLCGKKRGCKKLCGTQQTEPPAVHVKQSASERVVWCGMFSEYLPLKNKKYMKKGHCKKLLWKTWLKCSVITYR